MKKFKRVFLTFLAVVIVVSALSGCNKTVTNDDGEVVISITGAQGATTDWQGTSLIKGLEEKFGVKIDCQPVTTEWDTKFSLMLSEDNLPDLVINTYNTNSAMINNYGSQGYFLAINEYLDHMPNLKKFFKEHPEYEAFCTSADGNIYMLAPYLENKNEVISRMWIQRDWLDNVGMDYPETIDDFYDVLVAFRDKDANGNGDTSDEIPLAFSSKYARKIDHALMPAFGINSGGLDHQIYYLPNEKNGKIYLEQTTENYKEYLKFMNKLWDENLLYHECYTIDIAGLREKIWDDKVGVYSDASGAYVTKDGSADYNYDAVAGLTSKWNDKPFVGMKPAITDRAHFLISSSTKHPEKICEIIDFFYSEEGRDAAEWGFEERTLEPSKVEGFEDFTLPVETTPEGFDSYGTYVTQKLTINDGFSVLGPNLFGVEKMIEEGPVDKLQNLLKLEEGQEYAWAIRLKMRNLEYKHAFMPLPHSEEVVDEFSSLKSDISNYIKNAMSQFITGQLDIEKDWDSYIDTLNKMGLPRLIEIEQEAYDDFKDKM